MTSMPGRGTALRGRFRRGRREDPPHHTRVLHELVRPREQVRTAHRLDRSQIDHERVVHVFCAVLHRSGDRCPVRRFAGALLIRYVEVAIRPGAGRSASTRTVRGAGRRTTAGDVKTRGRRARGGCLRRGRPRRSSRTSRSGPSGRRRSRGSPCPSPASRRGPCRRSRRRAR